MSDRISLRLNMVSHNNKANSWINDEFLIIEKYIGDRKDGLRHGRGVYFYPNGDIYDGEWRKSRKYGHGVYTYSDEHRLEGYFYKDEYIGKEPNEKIRKKEAKEQKKSENLVSIPEIKEISPPQHDHNDIGPIRRKRRQLTLEEKVRYGCIDAEEADERRMAKESRESIRQKYNLPTRHGKDQSRKST